jgi:hypothetical protein
MIRRCDDRDFEPIWTIINDGAQAPSHGCEFLAQRSRTTE